MVCQSCRVQEIRGSSWGHLKELGDFRGPQDGAILAVGAGSAMPMLKVIAASVIVARWMQRVGVI